MIVKLIGNIDLILDDCVHLDVSGIVYKIFLSEKDISIIKSIQNVVSVNIHEIYREDGRYLFGFYDIKEKNIFEKLIKVQGVGGKMALNILSILSVEKIISAVKLENIVSFTQISGIGLKLAQRLINELKDKFEKEQLTYKESIISDGSFIKKLNDLSSCIVNLGYQPKIANEVSNKIIQNNSQKELEELIPLALKYLKNFNLGNH